MRFRIAWLFLFFFLFAFTKGQNLVLNPSLEEYEDKFPAHWRIVSGKPFIDTQVKSRTGYPCHIAPPNTPFAGPYFGNTCFCLSFNIKNTDILQAELKSPLQAGKIYLIKIQLVKPKYNCPGGVCEAQVVFTSDFFNKTDYSKSPPQPTFLYTEKIDTVKEDYKWVEFSAYFKAGGGEKYISVGNFLSEEKVVNGVKERLYRNMDRTGCSHHYYDSLTLEPVFIQFKKPIVLGDLFFEPGKSVLLPRSISALNKLYTLLTQQSFAKIKISGHTDNSGDPIGNMKLSKERAQAIVDYLTGRGVEKSRLRAEGYGDKKPVSGNETEEGRAKNRRVEMEYLE